MICIIPFNSESKYILPLCLSLLESFADPSTDFIYIAEKPELTITVSDPLYQADLFVTSKKYVINCTATCKPTPWVWWEWAECEVPDATCFSSDDPRGMGLEWKVLPPRLSGPRMSEISVDATFLTTPRMLRCYANSTRFEVTRKDQLFIPTGEKNNNNNGIFR